MSIPPSEPPVQNMPQDDRPAINFDFNASLADIERRLEEARRNAAHESIEPQHSASSTEPQIKPATPSVVPPVSPPVFESSFLAELAQESAKKREEHLSETQALQARSQCLHEALSRIIGFFTPLIQYANSMEPDISRNYPLDARTTYTRLKWRGAFLDTRKQDLSSTALLAHITFSVNYCTPESILVTRPWNQLDALKTELNTLKLKALDESELDSKRPKQEWLQVRLAPEFPVHIKFQANYDRGHIEIISRNLLSFGISSFKLKPEDVTPALLDDLGRVLLGRTDKLPPALLNLS